MKKQYLLNKDLFKSKEKIIILTNKDNNNRALEVVKGLRFRSEIDNFEIKTFKNKEQISEIYSNLKNDNIAIVVHAYENIDEKIYDKKFWNSISLISNRDKIINFTSINHPFKIDLSSIVIYSIDKESQFYNYKNLDKNIDGVTLGLKLEDHQGQIYKGDYISIGMSVFEYFRILNSIEPSLDKYHRIIAASLFINSLFRDDKLINIGGKSKNFHYGKLDISRIDKNIKNYETIFLCNDKEEWNKKMRLEKDEEISVSLFHLIDFNNRFKFDAPIPFEEIYWLSNPLLLIEKFKNNEKGYYAYLPMLKDFDIELYYVDGYEEKMIAHSSSKFSKREKMVFKVNRDGEYIVKLKVKNQLIFNDARISPIPTSIIIAKS